MTRINYKDLPEADREEIEKYMAVRYPNAKMITRERTSLSMVLIHLKHRFGFHHDVQSASIADGSWKYTGLRCVVCGRGTGF